MQASNGFSLIDSSPSNVSDLPAGGPLKSLVWVGDYDNSSCSFAMSDATLTSHVNALKEDSRVGVWFISDEPNPSCPNVYAEHKKRSDLIHSLDPNAKTLILVDGNSGEETLDQLPHWKGTADHIAVDPYTCWQDKPCELEWIDKVIAKLDASGITDYWGVIQAFEDGGAGYTMESDTDSGMPRWPTPDEIHAQFERWRVSKMTGYLVFAWRWPPGNAAAWLENHPVEQYQLKLENAR